MTGQRSSARAAESDFVNSNIFVEGTKLEPPKIEPRMTIRDSSLDLAQGCEAQEVEFTSSMMGLFD